MAALMMTPAQHAEFTALRDATEGLCGCDGSVPARCDKQHDGSCTGAATEPVMDPSGHVIVAVCRACKAGRIAAPARANRRAKAARAKGWAEAQTSIFSLLTEDGADS